MQDDVPIEDDPHEGWDEEHNEFLYLKYTFDGCSTLAELSGQLRALADHLACKSAEGWQLAQAVEGGHAHLCRGVL